MKEAKGGFFQEEGADGNGLYKTVDDTRSDLLDPGVCVSAILLWILPLGH